MTSDSTDLRTECKRERNFTIGRRILAVHMVCEQGLTATRTAELLMQCPDWVGMWVRRYREGGIAALRDCPRTGRTPKVPHSERNNIRYCVNALTRTGRTPKVPHSEIKRLVSDAKKGITTPAALWKRIRDTHGVQFHISHVRRMMRRHGMSPKTAQMIHVRHAAADDVRRWQDDLKRQILRLKRDGFMVIATDEAFFVHDPKSGRKYWSPVGQRITLPYTGRHQHLRCTALADDGTQMFRTYKKFDGKTFLAYVRELQHKFGRVAMLCDRAAPHRTKALDEFLWQNGNVRIIWLPVGSPYLNPVEACWNDGKRELLVSEYYPTFDAMCKRISEYYRTVRFRLDLEKFLFRSAEKYLMNLCS